MLGSSKKPFTNSTPSTPSYEEQPQAASTSSYSSGGGDKVNALLGKGSEFEGKLSFEGTVKIGGVIKGEISSKDKLIIDEGARVEAEISVGSALISGNVTGNVTAKERIELKAPAKIKGNITTPILIIEEGVTFDGNCSMGGSATKASNP